MVGAVTKLIEVLLFTLAGVWQGVRQDWNPLEIALIAGVFVVLKRGWPERGTVVRFLATKRIEERWARLAHRRVPACWLVALSAIVLRLSLLPVMPVPTPVVSDEFSHLLLADTLLQGRVANPTHPFWVHFESLHIIHQPHYVSNYFPGQGIVLAAARWATGSPWIGVLALSGVCCGLICWMLQAWLPPRWALFGALIAILRFSVASYWINAYHGGFLAAIGGALVAGAYPRLRIRPGAGLSAVFGLGIAILAYSRPFEGLLFALPFGISLLLRRRQGIANRVRTLAVAGMIVIVGLVGLGEYFYRITGSPFTTPYSISRGTYGWPTTLIWTRPFPVEHRHQELLRYWEYERDEHEKVSSPTGFIQFLTFRAQEYWRFFLGPALTLPLLFLGSTWRRRRLWALLAGVGGAAIAVLLEGAASPHYLAPAAGPIVAVITLGCYRMWRSPRGPVLCRALPAILAAVLACRIGAQNLGLPYTQDLNFQSWCCRVQGNPDKPAIAAFLLRQPGKQLVLVRPKADVMNLFQWIYNEADIDRSRIVWARDLGAGSNRKLIDYFNDREVWTLDPDQHPATLSSLSRWKTAQGR